ncbi:hypothetical protein MUN81_01065 [Hymenobacter sp. 5317J-9]|uniref:hypothetical protein n=1 Tax=Hymenobacter sp. 5317J-9 TaxID=2932250 RepID=UPI001FD6A0B6|nr:hypothetical protein [Hymenobacter sp. 5317J-9]UOQ98096.1 hypothetical protein MUN81_01065 [Hymenobacter sp. 5317J-9]
MCKDCFLKRIDTFATWQDFESFIQILEAKQEAGQLLLIEKPASIASSHNLTAVDGYYQCSSCNEIWALSSPDNAWRGYFLPLEIAIAHVQRIKITDRMKGIGGLILIAAALLFLLWKMLK